MTLPSPIFVNNRPAKNSVQQEQQKPSPIKRSYISFCKYCQEGFSSDTELFQHRRSHVACPFDECKFNANEKVIAAHVQKVHLKQQNNSMKISDITTPEEIEKWKEERRKRYPTTQNIILRQQIQEDKFKRGERLHDSNKRFGNHEQRDFIKNMGRKQNNNQQQQGKRHRYHDRSKQMQQHKKIKSEEKVSQIQMNQDSLLDEKKPIQRIEEILKVEKSHSENDKAKKTSSLSLLGMYGSDSEDDSDNAPVEIESNEKILKLPEKEVIIIDNEKEKVKNDENQEEAPEEIPTMRQSDQTEIPLNDSNQKLNKRERQKNKIEQQRKFKRRWGLDYSKLRQRSVNPFLEKLLERDIIHERNVLLQCVNYVVKNNFFEVGHEENTVENLSIV